MRIVKRKGHKEEFDERKVYASAYAACLNVHLGEEEAEDVAFKVCEEIKKWIENKREVSSQDIFKVVTKSLKKYNEHAAFMYETHRDIS